MMISSRLLDENALKEREQKIITVAIILIRRLGLENLTIDKVVAEVPFSKGTVYKHFLGKEDLLLAISNYAIQMLSDLFYRAYLYKRFSRERMLLLNFSYLVYAILYPELFQAVMCAKSQSVIGKSSTKRLNESAQLQDKLLTVIHYIVDDGLSDDSLSFPKYLKTKQFCFANWSMVHGVITLLSSEIEGCSGRTNLIIECELLNNSNLLFDGIGWKPLTKDKNQGAELMIALQRIFPQELALIKKNGRQLNIS